MLQTSPALFWFSLGSRLVPTWINMNLEAVLYKMGQYIHSYGMFHHWFRNGTVPSVRMERWCCLPGAVPSVRTERWCCLPGAVPSVLMEHCSIIGFGTALFPRWCCLPGVERWCCLPGAVPSVRTECWWCLPGAVLMQK